jgi:uncharacterized integral membrane protein
MTAIPTRADETAPVESPAVAPLESRGQRLARHGRRTRLYAWAVIFVAALVVLIVLIAANIRSVKLDWVVGSTHASLVWIILAATVLGWLLGIATSVLFRHRTRRPVPR